MDDEPQVWTYVAETLMMDENACQSGPSGAYPRPETPWEGS
jgi:hypothetical protein